MMRIRGKLAFCIVRRILHVCLTSAALPLQYVQVAIKIVVDRKASTVVFTVLRRKGLSNYRTWPVIGFLQLRVP